MSGLINGFEWAQLATCMAMYFYVSRFYLMRYLCLRLVPLSLDDVSNSSREDEWLSCHH